MTLTLYKTNPPEQFRDAKTLQNEVLYDSLWLLFAKFWNSHFLMAAILAAILNLLAPQIFEVETKIVFNLSKPCSVPNLKLVSIWDT